MKKEEVTPIMSDTDLRRIENLRPDVRFLTKQMDGISPLISHHKVLARKRADLRNEMRAILMKYKLNLDTFYEKFRPKKNLTPQS